MSEPKLLLPAALLALQADCSAANDIELTRKGHSVTKYGGLMLERLKMK